MASKVKIEKVKEIVEPGAKAKDFDAVIAYLKWWDALAEELKPHAALVEKINKLRS